ncbi:Rieske (2Fe-2S) protein [Sphingomonas sp. 22L2VL55-3]
MPLLTPTGSRTRIAHERRRTADRYPVGIKLVPLDAIADGNARNFVLQMRAGRFHGFVVRKDDAVFGYVDRCPHMGLPLAQVLDDYLTPRGDLIACSWHSALFEIDSGACVGGPCGERG